MPFCLLGILTLVPISSYSELIDRAGFCEKSRSSRSPLSATFGWVLSVDGVELGFLVPAAGCSVFFGVVTAGLVIAEPACLVSPESFDALESWAAFACANLS